LEGRSGKTAPDTPSAQANGSQLRKLGALYDSGKLRPVIDSTFPFDQTLEAMAHVEQGRTKAGKVVVSMAPDND
jgi:NADPH:quinone reductase-like Zn-dependent oxidoreductase